jgi:hypothetical protein
MRHLDRKRGKLLLDRCAFKFDFGEREGKQDRSTIFSFLEIIKNGLKKTPGGIVFLSNPNEIENNK